MSRPLVVLVDAGPRAAHDGAALAGFLGCGLRSCRSAPAAVAGDLVGGGPRVLLFAVEEGNLAPVLRVCRLLPPGTIRLLFGRAFNGHRLRRAAAGSVEGVLVGEPYLTARVLTRTLEQGGAIPERLPGLLRSGSPLTPREPLRDLDLLPTADYREVPREVGLQVALHTSRGNPHPCLISAERVWELPVRRRSVERVLEDISLHVTDHGARQLCFTDLCLNTDSDWLLSLCQGVIAAGLEVGWYGRIWADPRLGRAEVRLLRDSGCRGLEIDLFSGSSRLGEELATGADPAQVGALARWCHEEGVAARVSLVVGAPGELDRDRTATLAWLDEHGVWLRALSGLEPCRLEEGAPLRDAVHFAVPDDPAGWHDGGENNASRRATWVRELTTFVDSRAIGRPESASRFPEAVGPGVLRRLEERVERHQAADPGWRRAHLLEAGLLHGREAFCGPTTLEVDCDLAPDAARELVSQAAALGTRALVIGRAEQEVLASPGLGAILEQAAELDLSVTLRSGLTGVESADALRAVGDGIQRLEIELASDDDPGWSAAVRWLPVLAAHRLERRRPWPRLALRLRLRAGGAAPDALIERALAAGVDRLWVEPERGDEGRLDAGGRAAARDALLEVLTRAVMDPPFAPTAEPPLHGWPAEGDAPLVPGAGWPAGFQLDATRIVCPAGVEAVARRSAQRDRGARYAAFDRRRCQCCDLLPDCPVDRVDFEVRLGLALLRGPARPLAELAQPDCGLGERSRWIDTHPCLVGWDAARIDGAGLLHVCPECGSDPVGSAVQEGLATLWYSRALNEFRYMASTAARAVPFVARARCGERCRRITRSSALRARLQRLGPVRRQALKRVGAADRLPGG